MTPRRPCIVPFIPQVLSAGGYVNDLELTNRCVDWLKVQTAAEVFLTGFTPGCEDRMLCVTNEGPEDCTLKHLTISNPGNRIFLADGRDTLVPAGYSLCLRYDVQTSPDAPDGVWREVSKFGAAGVRGYHAGDGYFGPQPDIEFLDGGGLAWTVSQDAVDKRIVVAAVASGGGGPAFTGARVSLASTLRVPDSTFTPIQFDVIDFDTDGYYDVTTGKFTVPADGTYHVGGTAFWNPPLLDESTDAGAWSLGLIYQGVLWDDDPRQMPMLGPTFQPGQDTTLRVASVLHMLAGQSVFLQVIQRSGFAQSISGGEVTSFWVYRVPGAGGTGPPGPPGPPGSMTLGTTPVTGGTPGEFLTVGPGGTLSQSPGGGGGGPLTIGTTPVAGGSPGEVLTVGPDGNVGQSIGLLAGTPAGGDLGGTFPNPEVLEVDGGTWE